MPLLRDLFPSHERTRVSLTSFRAPLRGEIYPIAVSGTSTRYAVLAAWKGSIVRVQADGGDLYLQISTGDDAAVDVTARAVETGTDPIVLAPTESGTGCFRIPADTWLDVPFPADAASFALLGTAVCVARCHLSES